MTFFRKDVYWCAFQCLAEFKKFCVTLFLLVKKWKDTSVTELLKVTV